MSNLITLHNDESLVVTDPESETPDAPLLTVKFSGAWGDNDFPHNARRLMWFAENYQSANFVKTDDYDALKLAESEAHDAELAEKAKGGKPAKPSEKDGK